jgi:biopolymer transport protein ExbD
MAKVARGRLSMTSLIDVIFLLLLFFMLSSTFSKFGEIPIQNGSRGAMPFSDSPIVFARLDETGLSVNGRSVTKDTVNQAVAAQRRGGTIKLLLSVAEGATAQNLADALRLLGHIPDADFSILE